jgi:hypothetical protein
MRQFADLALAQTRLDQRSSHGKFNCRAMTGTMVASIVCHCAVEHSRDAEFGSQQLQFGEQPKQVQIQGISLIDIRSS